MAAEKCEAVGSMCGKGVLDVSETASMSKKRARGMRLRRYSACPLRPALGMNHVASIGMRFSANNDLTEMNGDSAIFLRIPDPRIVFRETLESTLSASVKYTVSTEILQAHS